MADEESLGAEVEDEPVVIAKKGEKIDRCVGDGVEPTPSPGIPPSPT